MHRSGDATSSTVASDNNTGSQINANGLVSGTSSSDPSHRNSRQTHIWSWRELERGLFGVLYTMESSEKERKRPDTVPAILFLIFEFFQFLGFAVTTDGQWGGVMSALQPLFRATHLPFPYDGTSSNYIAFQVTYWLIVFLTLISVLVTLYVGKCFFRSEFHYLFPIRFLQAVIAIFFKLFFIASLELLMNGFACDPHYNSLVNYPLLREAGCDTVSFSLQTIFGVLSVVILFFFAFATTVTDVHLVPAPNRLMACATPFFNTQLLLSAIIMTVNHGYLSHVVYDAYTEQIVNVLLFSLLFVSLYYQIPYQSFLTMRVRMGTLAISIFASLMALVSIQQGVNPLKLNRTADICFLIGVIPIYLLGTFVASIRRRQIQILAQGVLDEVASEKARQRNLELEALLQQGSNLGTGVPGSPTITVTPFTRQNSFNRRRSSNMSGCPVIRAIPEVIVPEETPSPETVAPTTAPESLKSPSSSEDEDAYAEGGAETAFFEKDEYNDPRRHLPHVLRINQCSVVTLEIVARWIWLHRRSTKTKESMKQDTPSDEDKETGGTNANNSSANKNINGASSLSEREKRLAAARRLYQKQMQDAANDLFLRAQKAFPHSCYLTLLHSFLLHDINDKDPRIHQLRQQVHRMQPRVDLRYLLFKLKMEESQEKAGNKNATVLDLVAYVEYQKLLTETQRYRNKTVAALKKFWGLFLREHHRVTLSEFTSSVRLIESSCLRTDRAFVAMMERYPKTPDIYANYADFKEFIMNDTEKAALLRQQAKDVAESVRQEQMAQGKGDHASFDRNAVITINVRGVIETVNPGVSRLFGYQEKELIGRNVTILIPAPFSERHDSYMARYKKTKESRVINKLRTLYGLHRQGHVFRMELQVRELIEKATHSMDALPKTRYIGMIEKSKEKQDFGLVMIQTNGVICMVNKKACEMFRFQAKDMVGQNVKMLMPDHFAVQHDGFLKRYAEGGEPHVIGRPSRNVTGKRSDGSLFPLSLAVTEDVIADETFYSAHILDMSHLVATVFIDEFGIIESVDTPFCQMFGYEKWTIQKENIKKIMPPVYAAYHDSYLKRYRETKSGIVVNNPSGREVTALHADGSTFVVRLTVTAMPQAQKNLLRGVIVRVTTLTENERHTIEASQSILFDRNGIVHKVGPAIAQWVGYTAPFLVGKNIDLLFPPLDPSIEGGQVTREEYMEKCLRQDQRHFCMKLMHENLSLLPVAVQIKGQDKTKMESANILYRMHVVPMMPLDAVIQISVNGLISNVNEDTCLLFGYQQNELLGKNIKCLMPASVAEKHDEYLKQYREGTKEILNVVGQRRSVMARHYDGSILPIELEVTESDVLNQSFVVESNNNNNMNNNHNPNRGLQGVQRTHLTGRARHTQLTSQVPREMIAALGLFENTLLSPLTRNHVQRRGSMIASMMQEPLSILKTHSGANTIVPLRGLTSQQEEEEERKLSFNALDDEQTDEQVDDENDKVSSEAVSIRSPVQLNEQTATVNHDFDSVNNVNKIKNKTGSEMNAAHATANGQAVPFKSFLSEANILATAPLTKTGSTTQASEHSVSSIYTSRKRLLSLRHASFLSEEALRVRKLILLSALVYLFLTVVLLVTSEVLWQASALMVLWQKTMKMNLLYQNDILIRMNSNNSAFTSATMSLNYNSLEELNQVIELNKEWLSQWQSIVLKSASLQGFLNEKVILDSSANASSVSSVDFNGMMTFIIREWNDNITNGNMTSTSNYSHLFQLRLNSLADLVVSLSLDSLRLSTWMALSLTCLIALFSLFYYGIALIPALKKWDVERVRVLSLLWMVPNRVIQQLVHKRYIPKQKRAEDASDTESDENEDVGDGEEGDEMESQGELSLMSQTSEKDKKENEKSNPNITTNNNTNNNNKETDTSQYQMPFNWQHVWVFAIWPFALSFSLFIWSFWTLLYAFTWMQSQQIAHHALIQWIQNLIDYLLGNSVFLNSDDLVQSVQGAPCCQSFASACQQVWMGENFSVGLEGKYQLFLESNASTRLSLYLTQLSPFLFSLLDIFHQAFISSLETCLFWLRVAYSWTLLQWCCLFGWQMRRQLLFMQVDAMHGRQVLLMIPPRVLVKMAAMRKYIDSLYSQMKRNSE